MELKDKLKSKIDRLLLEGHKIEFLESSRYEKDPVRIDKIKICKSSITSFEDLNGETIEKERFDREVLVDFEKYPILIKENAEEVYQHLLNASNNLLEKYLEE